MSRSTVWRPIIVEFWDTLYIISCFEFDSGSELEGSENDNDNGENDNNNNIGELYHDADRLRTVAHTLQELILTDDEHADEQACCLFNPSHF